MDQPETSFSTKLYSIIAKAEWVFLAVAVIALVMKRAGMQGDGILQFALSGLAAVYFLGAFKPPNKPIDPNADAPKMGFTDLLFTTTVPKFGGIGSAVGIIGIMFALLNMPGAGQMLSIGLIATGAAALILLYGTATGNEKAAGQRNLLFRLVMLAAASAFLLYRVNQMSGMDLGR